MGGRPLENPEGLAGSLGETQIVWLEAQGKPTMFGWKPWENPRCLAGSLVNAPVSPARFLFTKKLQWRLLGLQFCLEEAWPEATRHPKPFLVVFLAFGFRVDHVPDIL